MHGLILVCDTFFCERAARRIYNDFVADRISGDAFTNSAYNTGRLVSGYERSRCLDLVLTSNGEHVWKIDTGSSNINQDLAVAGNRVIPVLNDQ